MKLILNSGMFDQTWYLEQNPDVKVSGKNPLVHYLRSGWKEGRDPNPLFHTNWYLEQNPDVRASGKNPLAHYLRSGWKEGRDPSSMFDGKWYLERNSDVKDSGSNPLVHYWRNGRSENRKTRFSSELYLELQSTLGRLRRPFSEKEMTDLLERIRFEAPAFPKVSIILLPTGNFASIVVCLFSIFRYSPKVPFEILLLKNRETLEHSEEERLSKIPGLIPLDCMEKTGFLHACNMASQSAKGEYLHFLGGGTEVTEGWLDSLMEVAEKVPNCGILGSKVIDRAGKLLDAGGILQNDANLENVGAGDYPGRSQYNFLRDVDYCPLSSILIRSDVFTQLKGFDESYSTLDYGAVDLALKCREAGGKVVYQPFSMVVSSDQGEDEDNPHRLLDRKNFKERWAGALGTDQRPESETNAGSRDRPGRQKVVLVVDHYVPQHDRDAGSRSMFYVLVQYVAMGLKVKFWPYDFLYDPIYSRKLQQLGIEVLYGSQRDEVTSGQFEHWIQKNGSTLDFVFLSRPHIACEYLPFVKAHSRAKLLYFGHEINYLRLENQIEAFPENTGLKEEYRHFEKIEKDVWTKVDVVYYPSGKEAKEVQEFLDEKSLSGKSLKLPLYVFENLNENADKNLRDRRGLMFVGGFSHPPNAIGIIWFVEKVFPLIVAQDPGVVLCIVGSNPTKEVCNLAREGIVVTGFVTDDQLAEYYRTIRVAVAPLLYGGGMKGKVIESMSFGLPMVTTSAGAQGLEDASGLTVLDSPAEFAGAVLDLMRNDELWASRSSSSVDYARRNFSADAMEAVLQEGLL